VLDDASRGAAISAQTPPDTPIWHTLDPQAALGQLGSDEQHGLSSAEARVRRMRYGANALTERAARSKLRMLLSQFTDFMVLLLIAAAVISGLIGDAKDTAVILGIVILSALVGFAQDFRAARAIAALKRLAAPGCVVLRDGQQRSLAAEELVPGDIVLLEAGNAVPADLRLLETVDLSIGEAALTGESLPVEKHSVAMLDPDLPIADRRDMAFKGTSVLSGRGRGLVIATGMATELGRIAHMLEAEEGTRTPLQQRLSVFGRQIAVGALLICALVFAIGLLRGEPVMEMLLVALSLAVAAVPEALPAVVTVLLALGAARMARDRALIRRLPAVETLGSVTTICTDKTGTLTRDEMRAVGVFIDGHRGTPDTLRPKDEPARSLLIALALCNDVAVQEDGMVRGDPTEQALWRLAADAGIEKWECERTDPRVRELPFDSDRKRMTTIHAAAGGFVGYTKGAPEAVLARCTHLATAQGAQDLDRDAMAAVADAMAEDGLRVLAVAVRHWAACPGGDDPGIEQGLTLLGFVGLLDPPRPEAKASVATCGAAGINVIMITGDHPVTARAIAREVGLADGSSGVLTGRELRDLSDAQLQARIQDVTVYARVDPAQKLRLVAALQHADEVVAMTGDGVNDAPALARAEIGVAMGRSGTDVAREAASLVLLDDNFATIVVAVREGRRIYDNIRKFVRYIVTCNSGEIWTMLGALCLGLPLPLLPIQILWMNLVTDGLPGLALAAEPAEADLMRRPPRPPREGLFTRGMALEAAAMGLLMAAVTLIMQAEALQRGDEHWRTMVFTVLTLSQIGHALAIRSDRSLVFELGFRSNLPLSGAVLLTLGLQLALIYLPPLQPIFHTLPLTAAELATCLGLASVVLVTMETSKWLRRHRRPQASP
jgi:Ca2+-transporting ATPase